jgi:hypothetical protein
MSDLNLDIDLKTNGSGNARWPAVARPLLTEAQQWLTGATRPRHSGALLVMVPSSNQREGHNDPHLG